MKPNNKKEQNIAPLRAKPCGTLNIDKNRVALLLIDFQTDFVKPGGFGEQLGNDVSTLRRAIAPTKAVLLAVRRAGMTVIHTREGHRTNLSDVSSLKAGDGSTIGAQGPYGRILVRGEVGHDIIDELYPKKNETVIDKPGKGAFYQTDLELILKNRNVETLLVCGVTTEVCVHTTVREANDRGIQCVVLKDCTASYFEDFHEVAINMITAQGGIFGQVSDSEAVLEFLNSTEIMPIRKPSDSASAIQQKENDYDHEYGKGVRRVEVPAIWGGARSKCVWVVPILNVESFDPKAFGPSVQPHLNKGQPELANKGWRNYGNNRGLPRLASLFRQHSIPCTAVVSSDLTMTETEVINQLKRYKDEYGWEIGAHGKNNSNAGYASLTVEEEKHAISTCLKSFGCALEQSMTWLTPGFSVTNETPRLLIDAGIHTLLDFVDDDVPYELVKVDDTSASILCLPYSMETNDFSLILTRQLSPREYATALESHILQLARESRVGGMPTVVCLGMHTFVAGVPAVVHELDKILMRLKNAENVTFATAAEVHAAVNMGS